MDGRQGAVERYGGPQFLEGHIRFAAQQRLHLPVMGAQDEGLASGITMTGSDVSGAPALLQEFLDQPQRDTETMSNFLTGFLPSGRRNRGFVHASPRIWFA